MPEPKILIADDDFHCRNIISMTLSRRSYRMVQVENGREAIEALQREPFDLVLCDLMMPKVDGMEVLRSFKEMGSEGNFVLITAFGTVEKAVEAMKTGAYDFLVKPINIKQLEATVDKALDNRNLRAENASLKRQVQEKSLPPMIGRSPRFRAVIDLASRAAASPSTVLITGPSGTGKELVAKLIHYQSDRLGKPFVVVNCGAIPGALMESQLFGHVKGAFTGASEDRPGLFQQADSGSLFLDEVGEIDLSLQVKLLRAIQEGEVRRVGSNLNEHVDVRLIAATNRNLEVEVKAGRFREDLFYRLNVVHLDLPPLKDRPEDIPLLVEAFVAKYRSSFGKNIQSVSEDFLRSLSHYDFPGNIRELENIVQKAIILCEGTELTSEVLLKKGGSFAGEGTAPMAAAQSLHELVAAVEREAIRKALQLFNGNHSKVAKYLKIPRSTLYKKLHDYGLGPSREEADSETEND